MKNTIVGVDLAKKVIQVCVYDDKITFLEKVFKYLKDLGAAKDNYANVVS